MPKSRLRLRKFWIGIAGAIIPQLEWFITGELSGERTYLLSAVAILGYIFSEASEDIARERWKSQA